MTGGRGEVWIPYCGAAPGPAEWLGRWNFDPLLVAGLLGAIVAWRLAADAGADGMFAIDPLWPGLAVSALLLAALTAGAPRAAARVDA